MDIFAMWTGYIVFAIILIISAILIFDYLLNPTSLFLFIMWASWKDGSWYVFKFWDWPKLYFTCLKKFSKPYSEYTMSATTAAKNAKIKWSGPFSWEFKLPESK